MEEPMKWLHQPMIEDRTLPVQVDIRVGMAPPTGTAVMVAVDVCYPHTKELLGKMVWPGVNTEDLQLVAEMVHRFLLEVQTAYFAPF